ncbi:MAG: hypothetical protein JXA09_08935 [Anaerolineae bacterium]|nr:hypothetical protein [Anaerolineae bacterium]
MATPGHSAGHTAYHVVDQRALCCGDALIHVGPWLLTVNLYHDPEQMAQSAHAILHMDDDWLLPAHLSPVRHFLPPAARVSRAGQAPCLARILERITGYCYQASIRRG